MKISVWNVENMTGYKPMTTFWQDFSIADNFGIDAIKDTFDRAFKEWKTNYKYLTELVLVLNHKCWQHYEIDNKKARLYNKLYEDANDYAITHLKDVELEYYFKTID